MQLLCVLSLAVALAPGYQTAVPKTPTTAPAAAKAAAAKGARTIEIGGGDDMKFSVTTIEAKRGETLRIVLKSTGTLPKIAMAHNFVLLTLTADLVEFNKAAMMARETDFVPPTLKAQVLAVTTLAGPGETVEVTFKVPAKAGSYPYMCSFPGHFGAGMKGLLVVK